MTKFWKHKSDKPLVWGYTGWYYNVEYYGVVRTFIDIEQLREQGLEIAERRRPGITYSRPIWSKMGFEMRLSNLFVRYIHFRYRDEIVSIYERAYAQFSSEINLEV